MTASITLKSRYQGFNTLRLPTNPLEAKYAVAWQKINESKKHSGKVDRILHDEGLVVRNRDRKVAASIIQWLGSPVGESFVEEVQERRQQFARAWEDQAGLVNRCDTLDYILHQGDPRYPVRCSRRDREVAGHIMAWLDSSTGRTFIKTVLASDDWPDPTEIVLE